jgi:hypothetical protein
VQATGYRSAPGHLQELEGALLERSQLSEFVEGMLTDTDLGPGCGGELGQECAEAVHRKSILRLPARLLLARRRRDLRLRDDVRARCGGRGAVMVLEEEWRERAAQVPLDVVGEHAEEDVRPDPRFGVVVKRADVEVGLGGPEGPLHL